MSKAKCMGNEALANTNICVAKTSDIKISLLENL
jgi:hypothetical protein